MALNCLLFEKIAIFVSDRRTDGQNQCVKMLLLSRQVLDDSREHLTNCKLMEHDLM